MATASRIWECGATGIAYHRRSSPGPLPDTVISVTTAAGSPAASAASRVDAEAVTQDPPTKVLQIELP
jgi:hypothetical protein